VLVGAVREAVGGSVDWLVKLSFNQLSLTRGDRNLFMVLFSMNKNAQLVPTALGRPHISYTYSVNEGLRRHFSEKLFKVLSSQVDGLLSGFLLANQVGKGAKVAMEDVLKNLHEWCAKDGVDGKSEWRKFLRQHQASMKKKRPYLKAVREWAGSYGWN